MAPSISSADTLSGFTLEEIPSDLVNKNNRKIYNLKENSIGEIINIILFYNTYLSLLQTVYIFLHIVLITNKH